MSEFLELPEKYHGLVTELIEEYFRHHRTDPDRVLIGICEVVMAGGAHPHLMWIGEGMFLYPEETQCVFQIPALDLQLIESAARCFEGHYG